MVRCVFMVDNENEYWDVKDKLQNFVSTMYMQRVVIKVANPESLHVFNPRVLEEGKYVYYETEDKEEVC